MDRYLESVLDKAKAKNPHEKEFLQALEEVLLSLEPIMDKHPEFEKFSVLERICEPDRIISFRVPWLDDSGKIQVNRGYRVQFSSLIGPYKGGLRLHPSVNQSVMKFLGFEQIFKNALTGFPIGGGKGGSDFDPKGKSDNEVMKFCQSFMTELYRHVGQDTDVPAGDIGVGAREIGFLLGQYKKITNDHQNGVLTGKGIGYGGSLARKEATGYGLMYFMREMVGRNNLKGKTVVISGSGNVAIYAAEKAIQYDMKVVAMSDSSGYIYDKDGIDLDLIKELKEVNRMRISEYAKKRSSAKYVEGSEKIWEVKCDIALPCATQNELDLEDAKKLVANGVIAIGEGANMPLTTEATNYLIEKGVLVAPAKAANAGGVAVSSIEMSQNSMRYFWTFEEVDNKLDHIMSNIFKTCRQVADEYNLGDNYCAAANIAAFLKLASAMQALGVL